MASSSKRLKYQPEPSQFHILRKHASYGNEQGEDEEGFFMIDSTEDIRLRIFTCSVPRSKQRERLMEAGLKCIIPPPTSTTSQREMFVECAKRCIPFLKQPFLSEEQDSLELFTNKLYREEWQKIKQLHSVYYPTSTVQLVLTPLEKKILSLKLLFR